MDLLRFSTAGSVDDGKSTLIGRLLYDSKGVFEDQLEAVARSTVNRSAGPIDLSLLTDGLRAEREQGITIDVAYRYFATPRRKFIIADTPGHEQYTRNMATGASTANLSIVLIDARYGALVQSRRHTFIAHLLGIPHLVVAVNKMDLVDFSQARFDEIRADFEAFTNQLGFGDVTFVPLSALNGDNVVTRSERTPWYHGPTLLDHLETVDIAADEQLERLRFPVQYVIRPNLDFRGFAGQIAAGTVRVGDTVVALPSGTQSTVRRIHTYDGDVETASAPESITLLLADEIDISRGDMLVHPTDRPWSRRELDAHIVWMDGAALDPTRPYLIKHTTRTVRTQIGPIAHRVDVNTLGQMPAETLQLNEIGRVRLTTAQALFADPYSEFRRTGSFIVIDPLSNATVAAGMICADQPQETDHVVHLPRVDRAARAGQFGHKATVLWLTGTTGAPRQQLARTLETRLFQRGAHAVVVDDAALTGLWHDLGGSHAQDSHREAFRRLGELLRVLVLSGAIVIVDVDAPTRSQRETVRRAVGSEDFLELYVQRLDDDPTDETSTGLFEAPVSANTEVLLGDAGVDSATSRLLVWLADEGLFGAPKVVSPGAGI
jgi:sulfate adenylyltransferase large subunit